MSAVLCQLVAIGTNTSVGADCVVTPEGTLVALIQTLIDVLASSWKMWNVKKVSGSLSQSTVSARSITLTTLALKTSPKVGAGSIPAEVEGVTFVEVETLPARGVQPVPCWTAAPK